VKAIYKNQEVDLKDVVSLLKSMEEEKLEEERANKLVELLEASDYELLMALDEELFPSYLRWDDDTYTLDQVEAIISKVA
jgi:hypothetical protein